MEGEEEREATQPQPAGAEGATQGKMRRKIDLGPVTSCMDDSAPDPNEVVYEAPLAAAPEGPLGGGAATPAEVPVDRDNERRLITEKGQPFLRHSLVMALLVAAADYFIYRGGGGLGYAVFLPLLAVLGAIANPPRSGRGVIFPGLLLALLALHGLWQYDPLVLPVGLLLCFVFSFSLFRSGLHVPELLASGTLSLVFALPRANAPLVLLWNRLCGRGADGGGGRQRNWGAVLIPAGVCAVFACVFMLANSLVAKWIAEAGRWIWEVLCNITRYLPSFWEFCFWLLAWLLATAFVLPKLKEAVFPGTDAAREPAEIPLGADSGQIARNTLAAVNALFLVYNILDVRFLWVQGALPEGLSFSDYAHRGVFWLTLALALTSLVLGVVFTGSSRFLRYGGQLRWLGYVWIGQNIFLGLSAYERLHLYFGFNGLTVMRILGAFGITLVLVGLLLVGRMIRGQKSIRWLIRQQLGAFALALLLFYLCPCGVLTSAVNASLVLNAKTRDDLAPAVIIARHPLTAEGVSALLPLLKMNTPAISESDNRQIREGVAALLLVQKQALDNIAPGRWTEYSHAPERARDILREVEPQLLDLLGGQDAQSRLQAFRQYTAPWY